MSELKVNTIAAADAGQNLVLRGGDSDGVMPAGAVTFTGPVTLPTGSMIEPDDGGEPTPLAGGGGFTLGTPYTFPSSGESDHIITGIPAGVSMIVFSFQALSSNDTQGVLVQLGGAGGIETGQGMTGFGPGIVDTAYQSGSGAYGGDAPNVSSSPNGFIMHGGNGDQGIHGSMTMTLLNRDTNLWVNSHSAIRYGNAVGHALSGGGFKTLLSEITQLRLRTSTAGRFDAGTFNIMYQ